MKNYKIVFICFLTLIITSCGTTEKVIADTGTVYEVKGKKFYTDGVEVTTTLTEDEKDNIMSKLNTRLDAEKKISKQKESLEKAEREAKKAQEEAIAKQKEIERKLAKEENARQDFFKAKDRLKSGKEKYNRLRDKGKLSPNEEEEWAKKILGLEEDVNTAKIKLDKL